MSRDLDVDKRIKNAMGKRQLQMVKLDYSKEILMRLKNNSLVFNQLLDDLEITEEEFFELVSGDISSDISVYDQTLILLKKYSCKNNL